MEQQQGVGADEPLQWGRATKRARVVSLTAANGWFGRYTFQVLLGLQYQKQPDSRQRQGVHLGGVLVEILQWWWVGWWFQVREVEDLHGQVLPSCCPNLDNSGQFVSLVDS